MPNKALEKLSTYPKAVYNANEQVFKFAHYLHGLERGKGKLEAARDAIVPTFDYSSITPAVAFARSHFMPFSTWTSKVIPYTIEQAVKHPIRVGKWFALFEGLQQFALSQNGVTEEEYNAFKDKMPEHVQRGAYLLLPWRDSQDRLNMLDLTYIVPGIGDIREMVGKGIWETAFQHPATTIPADLLRNRKFSGEPITYDWQPAGVKRAREFAHIWESVMPSWFGPGGTDYNRYMRAMSEQPGAQTVGQAIAQQFGAKIQPLDLGQMVRMHESMVSRTQAEITSEMNKELRRTKDPEKRAEILRSYEEIRRRFLREAYDPRNLREVD